MHNDSVIVNEGRYFHPKAPTVQDKQKEAEVQATLEQLPLLNEVVGRLNEQIDFLNSLDSVDCDLSKSPATHQKQVAANRLARDRLIAERNFIMARVENATR